jgi:exonuclease SbcC
MKQIILEPGDIRLNTLRHVFGIDKYKRMQENAAILNSKLREKIRINQGIIYDLEAYKEELEQKKQNLINLKKEYEKSIKDYEKAKEFSIEKENSLEDVKEKINEKKALENEKEKSDILISEKTQQITTLENSIKTLKLQIEEAKKISFSKQEFDSLNQRIDFQQKKQEDLQKEYIEIISKINTDESKKREAETLKDKISKLQKCPTCLQDVSINYKDNIFSKVNQEVKEIQDNLNNFQQKKQDMTEQIDLTKKTLENFKKKKSELELLKIKSENLKEKEQRIFEIEKEKQTISKDLEILKKHITSIENSIKEFSKYDEIFKKRNKELQDAKQKENNAEIRKVEINKEIQFAEQQIKEKQEQIKEKEKLKQKTEKIKEIEDWISGKFLSLILFTEKQVMLTLKQEFSQLFSKWFAILVSDSLSAKLDEDFSPIIEQQDYELDYSFLSGGERTAIALAYRLSLNQVINSLLSNIKTRNLVILDEPTDGFSNQQLDKMRDVLNQLNTEQLILVSHEPKIEGFVDNIIKFTKEGGITRVER